MTDEKRIKLEEPIYTEHPFTHACETCGACLFDADLFCSNCGIVVRYGDPIFPKNPYKNSVTEAYCTAINILAVEYLVKTNDWEEYSKRVQQVYELTETEMSVLYINLSLNKHTSTLGAMITQGDYEAQRDELMHFLDNPDERL